jgi:hypothetical protein
VNPSGRLIRHAPQWAIEIEGLLDAVAENGADWQALASFESTPAFGPENYVGAVPRRRPLAASIAEAAEVTTRSITIDRRNSRAATSSWKDVP